MRAGAVIVAALLLECLFSGCVSESAEGMSLVETGDGFSVYLGDMVIFDHSREDPAVSVGAGVENITMHRGNFDVRDDIVTKAPLGNYEITSRKDDELAVRFSDGRHRLGLLFSYDGNGQMSITFKEKESDINRVWIRLAAEQEEHIYGLGEQYTYLDLRGHRFPVWVSEQGVGRNKYTYITRVSDIRDGAGGDYHTTYFPQPTYISSRGYFLHIEGSSYMEFSFVNEGYHEICVWGCPERVTVQKGDTYMELLEELTGLTGRQERLPEWIYDGIILGVQGGIDTALSKLKTAQEHGVQVSAIWAQDWVGRRTTSFGRRLMWNWQVNETLYPDLKEEIKKLNGRGIKFLGYINPYLAEGGELFDEARSLGYFVLNAEGEPYLIDFGEFRGGIVDLTNPEACSWYKGIIKSNMIGLGMSGWMADFGEYLPADAVLKNGESAEIAHNEWPVLWAKLNYEAVEETGNLGRIVYFMRSGFTGSQRYSTLIWAGDQNADWSLDDGLPSVIPAALSLAISGYGLHHSDIGGYTSIYGIKRTRELFMRWAEMAAFTPVMRTHEGNRPAENWQFDSDNETLEHLARMTGMHRALKPYLKGLVEENAEKGIPVMRPLFLHYEDDPGSYREQYEYLLGADVLVAPVCEEGARDWPVYLPPDEWVNLFTGEVLHGGASVVVEAPLGFPPVFYRSSSEHRGLFESITEIYGAQSVAFNSS